MTRIFLVAAIGWLLSIQAALSADYTREEVTFYVEEMARSSINYVRQDGRNGFIRNFPKFDKPLKIFIDGLQEGSEVHVQRAFDHVLSSIEFPLEHRWSKDLNDTNVFMVFGRSYADLSDSLYVYQLMSFGVFSKDQFVERMRGRDEKKISSSLVFHLSKSNKVGYSFVVYIKPYYVFGEDRLIYTSIFNSLSGIKVKFYRPDMPSIMNAHTAFPNDVCGEGLCPIDLAFLKALYSKELAPTAPKSESIPFIIEKMVEELGVE